MTLTVANAGGHGYDIDHESKTKKPKGDTVSGKVPNVTMQAGVARQCNRLRAGPTLARDARETGAPFYFKSVDSLRARIAQEKASGR